MRIKVGRRTGTVAAALAISAGVVISGADSAAASAWVRTTTSNWVGIYNNPNTSGKTGAADLPPGSEIWADCWQVGESIGNWGDTWYRVTYVWYPGASNYVYSPGWTFAGYVDNNANTVDRNPNIPRCQ
ncbi:hypothetical protein [Kitasatospora sp. NPDC091276]|uniref:hypothetical protein n=2 Tax=unclassified Kitasatospora TaxID=2633591 RepID=UPI00342B91BA